MTAITATEAPPGSIADGVADIRAGLRQWPVWWTLTWHTIRSQYRRTYLGPWWMTLQQLIFVVGLSLLFGFLMDQDLETFVPYVALGFMGFSWMTGMLSLGAQSIVGNAQAIKTTPGPLSIYALKGFARQTIQFAHDATVIVLVLIVFQVRLNASIVVLPATLALVAINGIAVALWLGPLVARYRDVGEIVNALVRVLFFFTPVFWMTSDLSRGQLAAISGWNPFTYLLQLLRMPLLGEWPSLTIVVGATIVTVANILVAIVRFSRARDRLAYWL